MSKGVLMTETDLRELAARGAAELAGASAEELLRWTDEHFSGEYVVASNMQDAVLVDLAAKVRPGVDVLFLDTGYHFAETIGTRDAVEAIYDVNVVNVTPEKSVAAVGTGPIVMFAGLMPVADASPLVSATTFVPPGVPSVSHNT